MNLNEPYRCRNGMPATVLSGDDKEWIGMIYAFDHSSASRMVWKSGGMAGDWESDFDLVNYERPVE